MAIDRTALTIEKQLKSKGWFNISSRKIEVDPKTLAYWIANLIDLSQSPLKPFAITEDGKCYVWDPLKETWNPCELKKVYEAVRRDPVV